MIRASAVLNRRVIRLVAALSVPLVVGWLFVYSQQMANIEVQKYQKEQKDNPTADRVSVKDYQLKEVDDNNHIRWRLTADSGALSGNNQEVELSGVKVEYFDGPVLKMRLIAPSGTANESTKYVKLVGGGGKKVSAEGQGGKARLEAQTVELIKKNEFAASGGVNIEWPEVAKVTGDTANGQIDLTDFKNFKIAGNTHAVIVVK